MSRLKQSQTINSYQYQGGHIEPKDFEGSLVLERLAQIGKLDLFLEAIDSDDFAFAKQLMVSAGIDEDTIDIVLLKMADSDENH